MTIRWNRLDETIPANVHNIKFGQLKENTENVNSMQNYLYLCAHISHSLQASLVQMLNIVMNIDLCALRNLHQLICQDEN